MKVIDRSPYIAKPGKLTFRERIEGSVMHGFSWPQEFAAQQVCIDTMGEKLGDEFSLFRNITLENLEIPIPLVLVGPPGLFVMYVTPQIGSFRAKENEWLSLESARKAKPVLPNLLVRTGLMARAVDVHLAKFNIDAPVARPVLICTNPHMFVEDVHSIVEVVLSDMISYYASNLTKELTVLSPEGVEKIEEGIVPPEPEEAAGLVEESLPGGDDAGLEATSASVPAEKKVTPTPTRTAPQKRRWFRFNRGQWLILGIISFLEVIALVIVIVLAIKSLGW